MEGKSLRARMLDMKVGESFAVPVGEYKLYTIRGYASTFGFTENKKFEVHICKETRTYNVTRRA